MPLLEVKHTALICISTPLSESNHYSELCSALDKAGKPVFRVIRIGLVCDACIAAGTAATCTHKNSDIPSWKSEEGRDVVSSIYGDRQVLLLRESCGMIAEDSNVVFPAAQIKAFLNRPPVIISKDRLQFIFVAIDPSGGGQSELAIVSFSDIGGKILVCFIC